MGYLEGCMSSQSDFKFERFEEYLVSVDDVKKQIDECPVCGSKLLLSHMPDYKNLLVQETARCIECGASDRKVIHVLN
jgi:ribosomal protein S27AE